MRGLPTLIRLARHELDERRRRLSDLYAQQDRLRMEAATTMARVEAERQNAREAGQVAFAFGSYLSAALDQRDRLLAEADRMEPKIAHAMEQVRGAFEEVKRLETLQEALEEEERRRLEEAERRDLDEIGLQRHVRRERQQGEG